MNLATKIVDVMSGREPSDRREPWDSIGAIAVIFGAVLVAVVVVALNAPLFPR